MMAEQHKDSPARTPQSEEVAKQRAMRENVMRVALTSEARQRLANIKMVKPEIANAIEEYIVQLVGSGRLKRTIDDEQLKQLLAQIQGQQPKREFKIKRV